MFLGFMIASKVHLTSLAVIGCPVAPARFGTDQKVNVLVVGDGPFLGDARFMFPHLKRI